MAHVPLKLLAAVLPQLAFTAPSSAGCAIHSSQLLDCSNFRSFPEQFCHTASLLSSCEPAPLPKEHPICCHSQSRYRRPPWTGWDGVLGREPADRAQGRHRPSDTIRHPRTAKAQCHSGVSAQRADKGAGVNANSVPSFREQETHVSSFLWDGTSFLFGFPVSPSSQTISPASHYYRDHM